MAFKRNGKERKEKKQFKEDFSIAMTEVGNLEHCGLNGKTPNEFLANYKLIKPPYVRT